jgi:hypothetical protein
MKGSTLIYRAGQDVPEVRLWNDADPGLKFLQEAVGGLIESVPHWYSIDVAGHVQQCVVYCNGDGKLQGLPYNPAATLAWDSALRRLGADGKPMHPAGLRGPDGNMVDILVGDIIVVTGDREFMRRYGDEDEC